MKRSVPGFLLLSNLLILPVAVVSGCCHIFSLLLPFFSVGVVVFSAAVVTLDFAVAVMSVAIEHKERAAGEPLISESP